MQQIEGIKNHSLVTTCLEILLQKRKTRNSVATFRHQFTVDECSPVRQFRERACDGGKFLCPVETLAGEQLHLAAVEPSLNAITVELDLMNPRTAVRRFVAKRGERGRHKSGKGFFRPLDRTIARRACFLVDGADHSGALTLPRQRLRLAG